MMGKSSTIARNAGVIRSVKTIGANGQLSLGKQFAGRLVVGEEHEPGVWSIRTASVVPDNERWLLQDKAAGDLREALAWAQANAASAEDTDRVLARLNDEA